MLEQQHSQKSEYDHDDLNDPMMPGIGRRVLSGVDKDNERIFPNDEDEEKKD